MRTGSAVHMQRMHLEVVSTAFPFLCVHGVTSMYEYIPSCVPMFTCSGGLVFIVARLVQWCLSSPACQSVHPHLQIVNAVSTAKSERGNYRPECTHACAHTHTHTHAHIASYSPGPSFPASLELAAAAHRQLHLSWLQLPIASFCNCTYAMRACASTQSIATQSIGTQSVGTHQSALNQSALNLVDGQSAFNQSAFNQSALRRHSIKQ